MEQFESLQVQGIDPRQSEVLSEPGAVGSNSVVEGLSVVNTVAQPQVFKVSRGHNGRQA